MVIPTWLQDFVLTIADSIYAIIPQPLPNADPLKSCKIISHRGEHDNREIKENTLTAFDTVVENGIWGIEFDVRWTQDLVPVVVHDPDCLRVFQNTTYINQVPFSELRAQLPEIPSLSEVVQRYGKKVHLMVELKQEPYRDALRQSQILQQLFSELTPVTDFHFITLHPSLFQYVASFPTQAMLPVAELNVSTLLKEVVAADYGGLTGSYLFLDNKAQQALNPHQKLGTGFIASQNALFRELNRGIEWIFSNDAVKLQRILNRVLKEVISQ